MPTTPAIPWSTYRDRVYGCWLGKSVAGTLGAPYEGWKGEFSFVFDPRAVATMAPNDDLDLQVLWLEVLERTGVAVTSDDLAEAFSAQCPYAPGEYASFKKNWARGIHPPYSGSFNNRYYINGMGCPIRSEIWACICPAQPDLAASYAGIDGVLDHAGDSVHFERYFAAIEAEAFRCDDLPDLLERNRRFLPDGSRARRLVDDALAWSRQLTDWRAVRHLILRDYGHPDCTNAYQNIGFTILALMHGGGDFIRTAMTALNCGFDTDCSCATAGAVLGTMLGAAELQRRHGFPDTSFTLGVRCTRRSNRLEDLAEDTCRAGLAVARHHGGVFIADAPADVAPLPPPSAPRPSIRVDYADGMPVIGHGGSRRIDLSIANPTGSALSGRLRLRLPAGWTASWDEALLSIPAGGMRAVQALISVPSTVTELAEGNLLTADFSGDGTTITHRFGLNGAQVWRVWGPFWENHAEMPQLTLGEGYGQHIKPVGDEPFVDRLRQCHLNTRADLERDYFGEPPATRRLTDGDGRLVNLPEDRWELSDAVGFQGPCVIYAERLVTCPDDRTVHLQIGHTDAYKLWLNGVLLSSSDRVDWWTAENRHIADVRLRAGVNRLLVRLARRGEAARFSAIFTVNGACSDQLADLGSRIAD